MSLIETSDGAISKFQTDVSIKVKGTTTNMSPVEKNTEGSCGANSPLEERLQHSESDTSDKIRVDSNSEVKSSVRCDSVNGFALDGSCSDEKKLKTSNFLDDRSDSKICCEIQEQQDDSKSQLNCECEKDRQNCDKLDDITGKSKSQNDEQNFDKLISNLNTSLTETLIGERDEVNGITYVVYESEKQMPDIMRLITKDLSEPYSIYTYRYFIHNWPKLCFLAMDGDTCVGAIVCKLDMHKKMVRRGYIAMLAVDSAYRRRKLGSTLVTKAIQAMIRDDCDEVVLETEITNQAALHLYENLGFVRDKRLFRYYLNGVDALRLKLWLR